MFKVVPLCAMALNYPQQCLCHRIFKTKILLYMYPRLHCNSLIDIKTIDVKRNELVLQLIRWKGGLIGAIQCCYAYILHVCKILYL